MRVIDTTFSGGLPAKKCDATVRTVEKWIEENDKVFSTAKWLLYSNVNQEYVATLKCSACKHFQDKLHSSRNFNPAFTVGCTNRQESTLNAPLPHRHTCTSVSNDT